LQTNQVRRTKIFAENSKNIRKDKEYLHKNLPQKSFCGNILSAKTTFGQNCREKFLSAKKCVSEKIFYGKEGLVREICR